MMMKRLARGAMPKTDRSFVYWFCFLAASSVWWWVFIALMLTSGCCARAASAATITTGGSGNWSSVVPNAPWPGGTKPTTGDDVQIAAGHTVTLDENTAVLGAAGVSNVAGSNTSVLDVSGTVTLNSVVSYSGTATTGFITVGTGDNLSIVGPGAGTTAVLNSSAGYCIVGSGTGVLSVTNAGGTAVSCTWSGRGIRWGSSGTYTITGLVVSPSSGYAVQLVSGNPTGTITGNLQSTLTGRVIDMNSGSLTVYGDLLGPGIDVFVTSGTVIWNSGTTRTIVSGGSAIVQLAGGTFDMSGVTVLNSIIQQQTPFAGAACTTSVAAEIAAWNRAVRPFRRTVVGRRGR
jgi:hypothetical protein